MDCYFKEGGQEFFSVCIFSGVNDLMWPYTLDNGIASICIEASTCDMKASYPGLWSIPMYDFFAPDQSSIDSMDPDTRTVYD